MFTIVHSRGVGGISWVSFTPRSLRTTPYAALSGKSESLSDMEASLTTTKLLRAGRKLYLRTAFVTTYD